MIKTKVLMMFILTTIFSCSGKRPTSIGVVDGRLKKCPSSPNCIISYKDDEDHYLAPIELKNKEESYNRLLSLIDEEKSYKLEKKEENYIYFTDTSKIFRFVDDVEFFFDVENQLIHFRSASRIGHSDLGVNKKRIEKIIEKLK